MTATTRDAQHTTSGSTTRDRHLAAVAWLEDQFPGWTVTVDEGETGFGELQPLWIATMEGHHPQAEKSAAKLHTRLSDYLYRIERREALSY